MTPHEVVKKILGNYSRAKTQGCAYAPSNIALIKYWGKRDSVLNLPVTDSVSISLNDYGATTTIEEIASSEDNVIVNGATLAATDSVVLRLQAFLALFRPSAHTRYRIVTDSRVPLAAGLASSACGFAALVLALADLYAWPVNLQQLSILARLGSGSAARSLWHGFVHWHAGNAKDGHDAYATPLPYRFPALRIGVWMISTAKKTLSSTQAMLRSQQTSPFYSSWPAKVAADLLSLEPALQTQDFAHLGQIVETNALAMHALVHTSSPAFTYDLPATLAAKQTIWQLRQQGLPVYFTQDAGPNLKLLFLENDQQELQAALDNLTIIAPFEYQPA